MKRALALALLVAACTPHHAPPPDAPTRALLDKLADNPDDVAARLALAEARRAAGDLEGALLEAYKASASDPRSARPHLFRARVYFERGLTGREIEAYKTALAVEPANVEAREDLAHALVADDRLDEAAAEYRAVLAAKPDAKEAIYNLAVIVSDGGNPSEARALWKRYLELDPQGAWAEKARAALAALPPEERKQ